MAKQTTLSMPRKLILWVIFFVIITGFSGLVYGAERAGLGPFYRYSESATSGARLEGLSIPL